MPAGGTGRTRWADIEDDVPGMQQQPQQRQLQLQQQSNRRARRRAAKAAGSTTAVQGPCGGIRSPCGSGSSPSGVKILSRECVTVSPGTLRGFDDYASMVMDDVAIVALDFGVALTPEVMARVIQQAHVEMRDRFLSWMREAMPEDGVQALIFTETKFGAVALCRELLHHQVSAAAIHGDKDQRECDRAMADFRSGRASVLIASGVAPGGLDGIKGVAYVTNYVPETLEGYMTAVEGSANAAWCL